MRAAARWAGRAGHDDDRGGGELRSPSDQRGVDQSCRCRISASDTNGQSEAGSSEQRKQDMRLLQADESRG